MISGTNLDLETAVEGVNLSVRSLKNILEATVYAAIREISVLPIVCYDLYKRVVEGELVQLYLWQLDEGGLRFNESFEPTIFGEKKKNYLRDCYDKLHAELSLVRDVIEKYGGVMTLSVVNAEQDGFMRYNLDDFLAYDPGEIDDLDYYVYVKIKLPNQELLRCVSKLEELSYGLKGMLEKNDK